jgi:transposase
MSRKRYGREFKESAVQLVHERGYSVAEAAQSLGIDGGTLRQWLKKFPAASGSPAASEGGLRGEVRRLREENKRLLLEREILKKATAFFAKQQP